MTQSTINTSLFLGIIACTMTISVFGGGCMAGSAKRRAEAAEAAERSQGSNAIDFFRELPGTFITCSNSTLIEIYSHSRFDDGAMRKLKDTQGLVTLSLLDSRVTDNGLKLIRNKISLMDLRLNGSLITDATADVFGSLENLKYLDIGRTRLSDKSINQLSKLSHLETLVVREANFSESGIAELRQMLPKVDIVY